jgi:hypothetical protein
MKKETIYCDICNKEGNIHRMMKYPGFDEFTDVGVSLKVQKVTYQDKNKFANRIRSIDDGNICYDCLKRAVNHLSEKL